MYRVCAKEYWCCTRSIKTLSITLTREQQCRWSHKTHTQMVRGMWNMQSGTKRHGGSNGMLGLELACVLGEIHGWSRDPNPIQIRSRTKKPQRWTQSRRAKGRPGAENQGGSNGTHGVEIANVPAEIMGWSRDFSVVHETQKKNKKSSDRVVTGAKRCRKSRRDRFRRDQAKYPA